EPSSPSVDLDSSHIPASALISGAPTITTVPPSPTSPPLLIRRQCRTTTTLPVSQLLSQIPVPKRRGPSPTTKAWITTERRAE
ncbi:unnamed protein product, partial [Tetraodon nigroviridis]